MKSKWPYLGKINMGAGKFTSVVEYKPHLKDKLSLSTL